MGIYNKNQRFIQETPAIVSSQPIDIKQLAEELAKHMKVEEIKKTEEKIKRDNFDESKTLENLANSMLINRNDKESNMGDMSKNTIEIRNNNNETNNTIDLLSGLDD